MRGWLLGEGQAACAARRDHRGYFPPGYAPPPLELLEGEPPHIRLMVTKLDMEANPAMADRYGVETYPICILFRAGEELERLDGYMPLRKIRAIPAPHLERS